MDPPQPPQQAQGMPVQPTPSSPSQIPQQFPMAGAMMPQAGAQFMPRGPYPAVRPQMMPPYAMAPTFVPVPGAFPRGVPPQYSMPFAAAPVPQMPGQPMMQQMPGRNMMPPAQMSMQQQTPQQPYVKRERKPLIIVDPKTQTPIDIPVKAKPAPSPALGPVAVPVQQQQQPPAVAAVAQSPAADAMSRPSAAAEEMRQKALMLKTGASPSPSMAAMTSKMESLKLDQMPEVLLPGPRADGPVRAETSYSMGGAPAAAVASKPVVAAAKPADVVPPPLAVNAPPGLAAGSSESAEDRKARAKREMDEKMRQKEEFEQKMKQQEDEAKRGASAAAAAAAPAPVEAGAISFPLPPVQQPSPSPTNKDSRIVFTRDQLLGFRSGESSNRPPEDLHPDFQDYQPRPRQRPTPVRRDNSAGGPPRVAGGPPQVPDWRKLQGGAPGQQAQQQGGAVAPTVTPLQSSQNAWKRTQPTSEHEAALRNIRSVLNRLAKENFPALSREILSIPITSLTMLQDMVRAIFDKALMEPTFGPVYAQLCREISERSKDQLWEFVKAVQNDKGWFWSSTLDVTAENALNGVDGTDKGYGSEQEAIEAAKKATTFKRLLLSECQTEFEKNTYEGVDEEEKQLKESMDVTTEEGKQKIALLEMKRRKIKTRVLGNMAFIGELYLNKMLTAKIINSCIMSLLGEEAIMNPHSFFESDKRHDIDPENIESICKLFQTIGGEMDKGDSSPLVEQYFKFLMLLEQYYAKSDRTELRTSRQRFMIKDLIDLRKARWVDKRQTKTVTKEEVRQRAAGEDASRAAGSGGGGGRGGYGGGGGGGGGGPAPLSRNNQSTSSRFAGGATTSVPRANATTTNRFMQGATATTAAKAGGGPVVAPRVAGVPTVAGARATTPTAPAKASAPSSGAKPAAGNGTAQVIVDPISEENLRNAYGSALEEYVVNNDAAEIGSEFKGLFQRFEASKAKRILVSIMAERVCERKEDERQALIRLLPLLIQQQAVLTPADVVDALQDQLEFLNDLLIDSPKAGEHMAKLINNCLQAGALSAMNVYRCMDKLRAESPEGAETLTKELNKVMSPESTKRFAAAANGEDVQASASPSGDWTDAFVSLVKENKSDNDLVQFLAGCSQEEVASRGFELFERIFEAKPLSKEDASASVTSKRSALKRLVQNGSNQSEAQAKALGSLASLSKRSNHPEGFLNGLFEALYKNDVVLEDAVNAWRSQASKEDVEAVSAFIKYLSEAPAEAADQ